MVTNQQQDNLQTGQHPTDRELGEINDNLCGTRLHPWEYRKVFNIILAAMQDSLTKRECSFLASIRGGERINDIAIRENLTVQRVRQIIQKAYLKIAEVNAFENILEENVSLKRENEELKRKNRDLKAGWSFVQNELSRQKAKKNAIRERFGDKEHFEKAICCLERKISDLNLSFRCKYACRAADIETVEDLVRSGKNSFLKFRNIGKKTIVELSDFLEDNGLEWGMDVDEIRALGPIAFEGCNQGMTPEIPPRPISG